MIIVSSFVLYTMTEYVIKLQIVRSQIAINMMQVSTNALQTCVKMEAAALTWLMTTCAIVLLDIPGITAKKVRHIIQIQYYLFKGCFKMRVYVHRLNITSMSLLINNTD